MADIPGGSLVECPWEIGAGDGKDNQRILVVATVDQGENGAATNEVLSPDYGQTTNWETWASRRVPCVEPGTAMRSAL